MLANKANNILVVEDSNEDFEATHRAFKKANLANNLIHLRDGDEAMNYFFADGKPDIIPNIVLLDLNLPGTDGLEVLKALKSHNNLKHIPVIILTTSNDKKDIEYCFLAGANSYLQKPVNLNAFIESIQRLSEYWFEVTVLPKSVS